MAEPNEAPDNETSFEEHPLYQTAMQQIADGDGTEAAAKLRELVELFPQEQVLQDLLIRLELRSSLSNSGPVPSVHSTPTPVLRRLLLVLLLITVGLVGIAGFVAAYDRIVKQSQDIYRQDQAINSLRQDGEALLAAGDCAGAQQKFDELLKLVPGDPTAVAGIEFCKQQQALYEKYVTGVEAQDGGDYASALDLLRQIEAEHPGYLDVRQRIEALERREAREAAWQQSESLIQAGDWASAIAILTQIRKEDPEFRRAQVEEQLYQLYTQLARQLLGQANGTVETLNQALEYLNLALALRPTQQDLIDEKKRATGFVAGVDASSKGDWVEAVADWEPIYKAQPDYQGGILRDKLAQAYPQAARQLIAGANGNVGQLKQAIGYLDKVLDGNQSLLEEKQLASEFVAGAEAFAQGAWDSAISHWGAIYAVRPDYQNGVLRDYLKQACAQSPTPNATSCPP